jgi:hypothetical protein
MTVRQELGNEEEPNKQNTQHERCRVDNCWAMTIKQRNHNKCIAIRETYSAELINNKRDILPDHSLPGTITCRVENVASQVRVALKMMP